MLFIWAYPFCLDGEGQAKKVAHSPLHGNCCIRLRGILHQEVIIFNSNIAILRVVFSTKTLVNYINCLGVCTVNTRDKLKPRLIFPLNGLLVVSVINAFSFMPLELEKCN